MNTQQEIKDVTHDIQVRSPVKVIFFCNNIIYSFKLLKDHYKDILTSINIIKSLINLICDITAPDLLGLRFMSENKFGAQFEGLWNINSHGIVSHRRIQAWPFSFYFLKSKKAFLSLYFNMLLAVSPKNFYFYCSVSLNSTVRFFKTTYI